MKPVIMLYFQLKEVFVTCFGFVELVDACNGRSDKSNDGMTVRSYTRSHSDLLCRHSNDCPTIFPVNVSQIHNVSRMSLKWLLYTLTCLRIPDSNCPIIRAREDVFVIMESRALTANKGHQLHKIKVMEQIETNLTNNPSQQSGKRAPVYTNDQPICNKA